MHGDPCLAPTIEIISAWCRIILGFDKS